MIKLVGALLVISSSTMLGFYFSNELKTRIHNLKELKKLLILLRGDIEFSNTPLPEAVQTLSKRHDGTFKKFLENISKQLMELKGETLHQFEQGQRRPATYIISKRRHVLLDQLGESIGYLDKVCKSTPLIYTLEQIDGTINELSKGVKERHIYIIHLG